VLHWYFFTCILYGTVLFLQSLVFIVCLFPPCPKDPEVHLWLSSEVCAAEMAYQHYNEDPSREVASCKATFAHVYRGTSCEVPKCVCVCPPVVSSSWGSSALPFSTPECSTSSLVSAQLASQAPFSRCNTFRSKYPLRYFILHLLELQSDRSV